MIGDKDSMEALKKAALLLDRADDAELAGQSGRADDLTKEARATFETALGSMFDFSICETDS